VQVKTVEEPQEVEINEQKIDRWDGWIAKGLWC
jgi:hypothetical protein